MRDVSPAFDREREALGRLVVPRLVGFGSNQRIERAVDFDAREGAASEPELSCLPQVLWIEDTAPRRIAPTRDTDVRTGCAFAGCPLVVEDVTIICRFEIVMHARDQLVVGHGSPRDRTLRCGKAPALTK